MTYSKKQKILAVVTLIPLILISMVIFRFSSQSGEQSTRVSNGLTVRLLSLFMDVSELSDEQLDTLLTSLRHKIRKTAHVLEYAAFGFFLELHLCTWMKRRPWIAGLIVSALYGFSDELHQYFVGERSMGLKDVGFDVFGAALGIGAYMLLAYLIRLFLAKQRAKKRVNS